MNREIAANLRKYFQARTGSGVLAAYLFGSEAVGRGHRESDVDVAILLDYARHTDRRTRADYAITVNADLVYCLGRNEVDVVVLNDAPPELGRAVVHQGERVYCEDSEADHEFVRDVQLLAADTQIFLDRTRAIKRELLRS